MADPIPPAAVQKTPSKVDAELTRLRAWPEKEEGWIEKNPAKVFWGIVGLLVVIVISVLHWVVHKI